ncbi:MAG: nucleotide sugar dehydrogenase [Anaerolineae bacterium]|nr:nucleotide sugar dehydrogenase [Anaerolineae bacterium]
MMNLEQAIREAKATVAVIGLGHVGLPVACTVAQAGFGVWGIERDPAKREQIARGLCPISGDEPGLAALLKEVIESRALRVAGDPSECGQVDVFLIAVETPVDPVSRAPAYRALRGALVALGPQLRPGTLVVVESTIAPGTMESLVRPTLEATSGLRAGGELRLAYCPERVMPGKLLANLRTCNRVIGGLTPQAAQLARELYRHFVQGDLDLTDALTAELVKTTENAYRDVQIAFANEIALLCENAAADVYRVRELVNKSPFRAMHLPGAGVGGHCTPKDPWLLLHGTRGESEAQLIPTARWINDRMPLHVADLAAQALAHAGKAVPGAKVAVLGYAYLENAADARNSPTIPLVDRLESLGAIVAVHDPYFREYNVPLSQVLLGSDCVIVMVAHREYRALDLAELKAMLATPILIDGRNVFDKHEARQLGFHYAGVGNL